MTQTVLIMPRIALQYIRTENGMRLYSPLDAVDAKLCTENIIVCDKKGERAKRSFLQNKSLQLYWRIICELLNSAGWTKKKYYEVKEVDVEWTPDSVGEDIWRGIQEAMYGHRRTSKLETDQVSKVCDVMNRHLANTCGVSAEFPSKESLMNRSLGRK